MANTKMIIEKSKVKNNDISIYFHKWLLLQEKKKI